MGPQCAWKKKKNKCETGFGFKRIPQSVDKSQGV